MALVATVDATREIETQRQGKFAVDSWFIEDVRNTAELPLPARRAALEAIGDRIGDQAKQIAKGEGEDPKTVEKALRAPILSSGSRNLVPRDELERGLAGLIAAGPAVPVAGSLVLLWWFAMLVFQGEGLEFDLQRRRHPMWEWLFSHPVGAGAVFLAEMLSPLAANPVYWTAPLFVGFVYGAAVAPLTGVAAALLIGIPIAVAAGCVGKSLEIAAMLRLAPRSRGAVIGIMNWFGFAAMSAMLFGMAVLPRLFGLAASWIAQAGAGGWPILGLFLGIEPDGTFSLIRGVLFGWAASALAIAAALAFSARSIRRGLAGAFPSDRRPARPHRKTRFGHDALLRKEYLWFVRDRSAIVQAILVPVSLVALQLFNLRGLAAQIDHSWSLIAGVAIFFGTHLLWVLGPKSLVSEGSALWIALTWPQGLEGILRAKARLWSRLASVLVAPVFLAACWFYPQDAWKVGLAAAGWIFFARSMAEKSVTLVTVLSESGEAEKVPSGRRWAAQLGMLTFTIGILTQQWALAVVGIVYSWITAAAMWEDLRARLPYLYDPWSERLPQPPTLVHAMVAISVLVECASVLTGAIAGLGGLAALAWAQGIAYGLCAIGTCIGVAYFLEGRGVSPAQLWRWRDEEEDAERREPWIRHFLAGDRAGLSWLLAGIGGGALLSLSAHFYVAGLKLIPFFAERIAAAEEPMRDMPALWTAQAVIAIGFAPFAEEYLFRGLLFRTLDREWEGRKAMLGAAAFFAIYHTPIAWLPVGLLGLVNCALFKRSGRLAPAVLLHMTYNAGVAFWS